MRIFELALLKETGVAADLSIDTTTRQKVDPEEVYVVDPENGPRPARMGDEAPRMAGKTLLDMVCEDYSDQQTQLQSKLLMRYLLAASFEWCTSPDTKDIIRPAPVVTSG